VTAGSGTIAEAVSQSISGLKPLTKYYYRISAQNTNGTANGAVMSFTTAQ
jgi:phosphodiesterase/alkaline phosphatase D-like protein